LKASKKKQQHHTADGWDYKKVNKIIEKIHAMFIAEQLTFVEEAVILNWFQCELQYNMGKVASKDYFEDLRTAFEKPIAKGGPYT